MNYGNPTYHRRDDGDSGSKSNLFVRIFDVIVILITLLLSVLLMVSYFAGNINPNDLWVFPFLGLISPLLYIACVVLTLYWIVRWKLYALIPLAVLLFGVNKVSLFWSPAIGKNYVEKAEDKKSFTVISYNVHRFTTAGYNKKTEINMSGFVEYINTLKPDILCLQEYRTSRNISPDDIDRLLEMPYKDVFYDNISHWRDTIAIGAGLAIYSRFPIIDKGHIDFQNSSNSAMWVDVLVNGFDTVRIFNNHLESNNISKSDQEFVSSSEVVYINRDKSKQRLKTIVKNLRDKYKQRATQADSVAQVIHKAQGKMIVCGDFNDTPMSYVYNTIRGDLRDSFVDKGIGKVNTYRGLFNLFRIDYIFLSRDLETVNYSTPLSDLSDHNPVVVRVKLKDS